MPIIVGSMRAVRRYRTELATIRARLVNGKELMAFTGWSRDDYASGVAGGTEADHGTLTSLAGNAFSAFSVGPLLLAITLALCTESHQLDTVARGEIVVGSTKEGAQ